MDGNKLETFGNNYLEKFLPNFYCDICDYTSCRKYDFKKHLSSLKHLRKQNGNILETKTKMSEHDKLICTYNCLNDNICQKNINHPNSENSEKLSENSENKKNTCQFCNKKYINRSGLWKHSKTCNKETTNNEIKLLTNVVIEVIKQNSGLQTQMFDFMKTTSLSNTNSNNINTNNNTNMNTNTNCMNNNNNKFNLNFFLNETCKNAMNITDFVDSLQLQLSDLESVGDLGFVEGISKIIIKNLKALDESERPIHCTDKKRESFYIKHDDKWEKEDDNKTHIRQAINHIAHENTLLIPQWKAKHPDYLDSSSCYSDKYNNMVIEVLGGEHSNHVNENKIIKKIAKEVIIDKQ